MKKIMKNFLFFLLLTGVCIGLYSCSNDDDEKETVVVDLDTVKDYDSISVDFRLINSEGVAVKAFKEGEQILFRLTVTNKLDKTLKVNLPVKIVGEDLFQIYSNGKPVDKPWDYSILSSGPLTHFWSAHKSYVYECPWQGLVYEPEKAIDIIRNDEIPSSGVTLLKKQDRKPLPVGNYYTEFKIKFNEESIITCHKDFSVIAK